MNETDPKPKVFISYSHDSDEYERSILALSEKLRQDGLDCWIDLYDSGGPKEGWPMWMERNINRADYVLLVCTETYLKRLECIEDPDKGQGVAWEGKLIYNELYSEKVETSKYIPVIFEIKAKKYIPKPLSGQNFFCVNDDANYEKLYRRLTNQPEYVPAEVGALKKLPPNNKKTKNAKLMSGTNKSDGSDGMSFRKRLLLFIFAAIVIGAGSIYKFYSLKTEINLKLYVLYNSNINNIDMTLDPQWQWFTIALSAFSNGPLKDKNITYPSDLNDYKAVDLNSEELISVPTKAWELNTDKLLLVYKSDFQKAFPEETLEIKGKALAKMIKTNDKMQHNKQ